MDEGPSLVSYESTCSQVTLILATSANVLCDKFPNLQLRKTNFPLVAGSPSIDWRNRDDCLNAWYGSQNRSFSYPIETCLAKSQ